jgi:metal-sulfur cluster biosynthetic enzyme
MDTPTPKPQAVPPPAANEAVTPPADPKTGQPNLAEQQVWDVLRTCYDPEIPVNIVDLGLVYDIDIRGSTVNLKMTLTAPGCHLGGQIAGDVQTKILSLDGIEEANVELVWDPPWHASMISAAGKKVLGIE